MPLFLCRALPQPSLHKQVSATSEALSTWLIPLLSPDDSLRSHSTQFFGLPKVFPVNFPFKQLILSHATYFLKISKRFTHIKKAAPGLGMICTSVRHL